MKSKYIKIFMIFAVVFAMVAGLFVTPALVNAEEQSLTATEKYDVDSITQSIPDTAIISFPVPYQSVYGNEIDWSVQEGQNVIVYDEEAHWMVVNRPTDADAKVKLYLIINDTVKEFPVTVPAGVTAVPSYNVTLNYGYNELSDSFTYKLGEATKTLDPIAREDYIFDGWYDKNDNKVEKILVGSMENFELTAHWTKVEISSIEITAAPTKTSYVAGEEVNYDGMVVTATYNNGNTAPIPLESLTKPEIVEFGTEQITVKYSEFSASFDVTVVKNTFDVSQIKFNDTEVTYNGDEQSISFTGSLPEGLNATVSGSGINASSTPYEITLTYSFDENHVNFEYYSKNYELPSSVTKKLTISKKNLTITPSLNSTIAPGDTPEWLYSYESFVDGENTENLEGEVVITYKDSNNEEVLPENFASGQSYTATFSGLTSDNYNIIFNSIEFEVDTVSLTLKVEKTSFVYDGTEHSLVAKAYRPGENGEEVEITDGTITYSLNNSLTNVGSVVVEISFTHPTYGETKITPTLEVTPKAVKVTAVDKTSVYGEALVDLSYTTDGLVEGDDLDIVLSFGENVSPKNVGEYTIYVTESNDNANYDIDLVNGTYEITPKNVTVTADNKTSVYGEALEELTYTTDGLVEGDVLNIGLSCGEGVNPKNVGEYDIIVSASNDNYNITLKNGIYTITKKAVTVTAVDKTSVYGEALVDLSYTTDGLVEGDVLNIGLSFGENGSPINVGEYTIYVTESNANANYDIDLVNGTYEITPKDLTDLATVVVVGTDANMQYESSRTPAIKAMFNNQEIATDYIDSINYSNNDKVGTATVTVSFKGNYSGSVTGSFEITEYGQAYVDAQSLPESIDETYLTLTQNTLPVKLGNGETKSSVLWTSSYNGLTVNPTTGTVTLNKVGLTENTEVTLTAVISYGTTSAYIVKYTVTLTPNPKTEVITDGNVTIVDAPYGYDVVANEVTDEKEIGNYTTAVEGEDGYEYLTSYNISLQNELGQSSQPNDTVKVRIAGEFDASKSYVVYYYNGSAITETISATVDQDGSYIEFETNHFSVYIIAVEKEEVTEKTVTVSIADYADSNSWANSVQYSTISLDSNIIVTATGGSNTGKYYTNGEDWRIYESDSGTFTISSNSGNIKTVKITYSISNTGVLIFNGNNISSEELVTVDAESIKFSVGNTNTATNGQVRITAIEVIYQSGSGESTGSEETTHTHTACPECGLCTDSECPGDNTKKCQGHSSIEPDTPVISNGSADLNTLSTNTQYGTRTTTEGWKAVNSAVLSGGTSNSNPTFIMIGEETTKAVCLNGKTSAVGKLTSPTLSNGISKLSFNYGLPFGDTKIGLTINIYVNGEIAQSTSISNTSATQFTAYEFVWELDTPVEGDFIIEIINSSPSNSTGNKDRTAIWNIEWTN